MPVPKETATRGGDKPLLWLVYAGADESARVAELSALGYCVEAGRWSSPEIIRKKAELPCAAVVDLSRSPSSGRDIAVAMRLNRELVSVAFIFIDGAPDRIAAIKALLPDAIETTWLGIRDALIKARANPPIGGRKLSVFAAYENKPLAEKLGIKAGATVALVNPPATFRATLGLLPEGAKIHHTAKPRDLTLWFVRSNDELIGEIAGMKPHAASGRLWIIWRKGAVAASSLNQNTIRKLVLANGLVDFRISRIDDEWAGLRVTIRK
jgi:hypothetical protein